MSAEGVHEDAGMKNNIANASEATSCYNHLLKSKGWKVILFVKAEI